LGAAAGGLLGAAFIPAAAAFADDYDIVVDPNSTEQITGIYGYGFDGETAPPAVAGSVQGDQTVGFTDTTTGISGTFTADETTSTDALGDTNQALLVISASGVDAPPVGSVFDTQTFDDGAVAEIYSAIPSPTGDLISDTVVTPSGDYTIPVTFDAADVPVADATGVPLGDGDDFVPDSASRLVNAINGLPPLFAAIQGDQLFDVDSATGTPIGTFDTDETTTTDFAGNYTQAVLVTSDTPGATVGAAAGDVPPVGSVFNTITFVGDIENVYSDIPSTTGGADVITDTVETPSGDFTIPLAFDAAAAEVSAPIDLPDGEDLVPASAKVFTGINGLPPEAVAIQGQQVFDYTGGTQSGSFDADVTNTVDGFGDSTETVLVTKDLTGADAPPVGSVFETVTWGDTGYENIYSDIASTVAGENVISDNLVTPFGDFTIPLAIDASSGLANDTFLNLLP
jgi:hypothetical protein